MRKYLIQNPNYLSLVSKHSPAIVRITQYFLKNNSRDKELVEEQEVLSHGGYDNLGTGEKICRYIKQTPKENIETPISVTDAFNTLMSKGDYTAIVKTRYIIDVNRETLSTNYEFYSDENDISVSSIKDTLHIDHYNSFGINLVRVFSDDPLKSLQLVSEIEIVKDVTDLDEYTSKYLAKKLEVLRKIR